jgi:hypothetical protein
MKERYALVGVEGKRSAHSLRAGFVTEAHRQNMPLPETMAMTVHHSVATVMGYFRAESALGSKVSRMLDETDLLSTRPRSPSLGVPPSCCVLGAQWNRRAASAIGSERNLEAGAPRSAPTSW